MTATRDDERFVGDTSRDALRKRYAALRRLTPRQRLGLMDELTLFASAMSREGVRRRHPGLSEAKLEARFFELTLGADLAGRVLEHRRQRLARRAS